MRRELHIAETRHPRVRVLLPNSPPSMEGATPLAVVVLIQAGALACWWLCGGVGGGLWAWRCDRDGVMEEWCTVPTHSRTANWTNWHHPITPSPHHTITRTEHHQVVRACHVTIKEDEPKYDATEGGPRGGGRPLREGEGERDARWP